MKLPFLDRQQELKALRSLLDAREPRFAVLYGRRRCGKSRLLQQLDASRIAYYLADQSDQALQRVALASQLDRLLPGFGAATYDSWESFFAVCNARVSAEKGKRITLILDEFQYLAAEDPALPSRIQKMIDLGALRFHLIICGSSQRMMKGLVLDETAPLYGRAREIIKIRPLKPGWIADALKVSGIQAVEQYALWGGIPRYWELAAEFSDPMDAVRDLVLNRDGILHNEPRRLLLDDMRTDAQPYSLMAIIGSGVHRISEMSARLEKSAMNLLRPLDILVELGMVRRDIPFGEPEKNAKKTLYSIADPFLRFWYRFVYPNLSALEQELYDPVLASWSKTKDQFIGGIWEDLARESVPHLQIGGKRWGQARRWWGKTVAGERLEIDIIAQSTDGSSILLGEAKWGACDASALRRRLETCAATLPFTESKSIVTACWIGRPERDAAPSGAITPDQVLNALR